MSDMRVYTGGKTNDKWTYIPKPTDYVSLFGRPVGVQGSFVDLNVHLDSPGKTTIFFNYFAKGSAKLGGLGNWQVTAVRSSFIHSILWNSASNQLAIMMRGGLGTYKYAGVPRDVHKLFLKALSKGSFYNHVIKGKYPVIKIK